MKTLENAATFLLLALLPVQDTVFQKSPLRTVGASLSVWPLMLLIALNLGRRLMKLDFSMPLKGLLVLLYVLALTLVYLLLWGTSFQDTSLVIKSLNLLLIVGLYLFTLFGVPYHSHRWLWMGAMAGFGLSLLGFFLGPILDSNSLLHATANLDARPRGFCTESSTFSVQVVISGLLAIFYLRHSWSKLLLFVGTIGLLIVSGSKGGLLTLLLCSAVFGLVRAGFSITKLLLGTAILVPVGMYLIGLVNEGFQNDLLSSGSSVATRGTMIVFALLCNMHNPLGVGFSGFYPAMARYLPEAMSITTSFFNFPLIFTEVSNYQYTMENADCKTLFFDFLVYFGLPFAVGFIVFFWTLLRRLYRDQQFVLFVGALFSCIALVTYYSSLNTYSIPVLLGVCLSAYRHEDSSLRLRA